MSENLQTSRRNRFQQIRQMISIAILLGFSVMSVSAQTEKSIETQTSELKSESWKEFVAEDKSFKILFPAQPKKDALNKLTFGGILDGKEPKRYFSTSGNVTYFVGFKDYPAPIINEVELRTKYESMFFPWSADKDVYVQKNLGVEKSEYITDAFEIFDVYSVNAIYRVFIIKQRLFILAVFYPYTYLNESSPNKKKAYQENIENFFNSFTVMEIPAAKHQPTPLLPKDFGIVLNGRNFQSKEIDLSFQLPANWKTEIYQPSKTETNSKETDEFFKKTFASRYKEINRKRLFFAGSSTSVAEFWLTVIRREFVNTALDEFVKQEAFSIGAEVKEQVVNGRKFKVIDHQSFGFTVRRFYTDWKDFILEIGMGYADESDKKIMEDSLKTLKFLK